MGSYFSFFTRQRHSEHPNGSSGDKEIPSWCKNTADFAEQTTGEIWDWNSCEEAMNNDISEVYTNLDKYIFVVNEDIEGQQSVVLNNFDNSSYMDEGHSDDPRWTVELTARVREKAISDGRNISADEKMCMKNMIKKKGNINSRVLQNMRGDSNDLHFGVRKTVFTFSGHAGSGIG
jgi:hypothetical protein